MALSQKPKNKQIVIQFLSVFCCAILLAVARAPHASAESGFVGRLSGRILLQVQDHGEAWYIYPRDLRRYYLGSGRDAFNLMRSLGLGITNENLSKIPTATDSWSADPTLLNRVKGMILLQVESRGEAWYVNPVTGKRYYMQTGDDAFRYMRQFGLGATTETIFRINPSMEISFLHMQGSGSAQADEYLEIRNAGNVPINLDRWAASNRANQKFFFPKRILDKQQTLRVYTNAGDARFSQPNGIWNDTEERATLIAQTGSAVDVFLANKNRQPPLQSMTFTSQAPTGQWVAPYDEACEEAILVMIDHFYRQAALTSTSARDGILSLVAWENQNLGKNDDTGVRDTGRIAQAVYGYRTRIIWNDISISRLRELVQAGKPVVIPTAGQDLGNTHFSPPGPPYHMVVVLGYENGMFIVHDPGTRYGKLYKYPESTLVNAIHDLTNPVSNIRNGPKAFLVIDK